MTKIVDWNQNSIELRSSALHLHHLSGWEQSLEMGISMSIYDLVVPVSIARMDISTFSPWNSAASWCRIITFSRCLNKEIYLMDECVGLFACLISVFCVEGIKDINICNNKMVNNVSMFLLWGVDCNLSRVYYLININKKFIQMQANIKLCSRI